MLPAEQAGCHDQRTLWTVIDALVLKHWDHRGKAPAPRSLEQGTKSLSPHQGKPCFLPQKGLKISTTNSPPSSKRFSLKHPPLPRNRRIFSLPLLCKTTQSTKSFPALILSYAGGLLWPRDSRGETDVQQIISAVVQRLPARSLDARASKQIAVCLPALLCAARPLWGTSTNGTCCFRRHHAPQKNPLSPQFPEPFLLCYPLKHH